MNQNQNPQMPSPPGGVAATSPQTAADLRYAADLIKAVGGDIALLAQNQNEELGQLESLSKQVAYIREVLDYGLFVTPEQVERKEDLYPFAAWMYSKLEEISQSMQTHMASVSSAQSEPQIVPQAAGMDVEEVREVVSEEVRRLESSLAEAKQSLARVISEHAGQSSGADFDAMKEQLSSSENALDTKLNELGEYVQRMENRQNDTLQSIRGQLEAIKDQAALSPYDDFDVQVEELRIYLKDQTARWRVQENIFFGAVILMLFVNMGLLVWLNLTS